MIRRTKVRRTAREFAASAYSRKVYPTSEEITEAVLATENVSINGVFYAFRAWVKREVLTVMEEKDPQTKLRRHLLVVGEDGEKRWHPHEQLSFDGLYNSGLFVTRPNADAQARAERVREIEREVVRELEQSMGRPVTAQEAWPEVEAELVRQGLR
jgi:hypothetical protein